MNTENNELEGKETLEDTLETAQETQAEQEGAREESVEQLYAQSQERIAELEERVSELEDKNLRMMAEFDNFRRRTNKEKIALMESAGERIFTDMLPLVDDFERAKTSLPTLSQGERAEEQYEALREGVELIYQKFVAFLEKNDVHVIATEGAEFNTDEHEAVTTFAAGEENKGKVIDCTQKGYKLGDKVIRFAKVVVGE